MTPLRSKGLLALLVAAVFSSCALTMDFDELQEGGELTGGRGGNSGSGNGAVSAGGDGAATMGGSTGEAGAPAPGGAGGDAGSGSIPLEDAAAALADTLCAKLEACLGSAAFNALNPIEDCRVAAETGLANSIIANIQFSQEAGTLTYDGSALPGCLEAYQALPCDEVTIAFPEACKLALDGLASEGGDCTHALECEAGLYCAFDAACPGTCTAPLEEDAPCADGDVCAPGLTCFQGACAPLGGEGDDCGGNVAPGCVLGFACFGDNPGMMTPGTCFSYKDAFVLNEGQSCTALGTPSLCKEDLYCAGGKCVPQAESGGPCQVAFPEMCPPGEYCNAGTCSELPGPNEPCRLSLNPLDSNCQAYLRCVNLSCRQVAEIGEPCTAAAECWSGACGPEGECVPSACQ